ncbi:MAG: transferrin-binding protein-like solute binding protein [Neisseriaceae bacterium]|nr:transferrin-binding protein-like solute binding protein [Neisseriaceae bacterium]
MNKLVLAISTASYLALTACGGGGGGEPGDSPVTVTPTTNPSTSNGSNNGGSSTGNATGGSSNSGSSNSGSSNSGSSGGSGSNTSSTAPKAYEPAQESSWNDPVSTGKPATFKSAAATGSHDTAAKFNKVTVNGTEMDIIPNGFHIGKTYNNGQSDYQIVVGGNGSPNAAENRGTAYARYGFVYDKVAKVTTIFYQGVPTSNMPTTGSATYKGYALAYLPEKDVFNEGESSFNVDFANKKLTGTLSNWGGGLKAVSISSTITGNTFKGDNNQGKFYGSNAQNLAGSFVDKTQKLQGAFGANKQ